MKTTALFSFLLLFYSVATQACRHQAQYEALGWNVIPSSQFESAAQFVKESIKSGLKLGTVIFDISGPILTDQTVDHQELLLDAMMFDNLKTDRDIMFGDFAILETSDSDRHLVEVRWFDGMKRNIVINPAFLECMSESAPLVENSVL